MAGKLNEVQQALNRKAVKDGEPPMWLCWTTKEIDGKEQEAVFVTDSREVALKFGWRAAVDTDDPAYVVLGLTPKEPDRRLN